MSFGILVNGPSGERWLDMSNMTSRIIGTFNASAGYTTGDEYNGTIGGWNRYYNCPSNTTPWGLCIPVNEQTAYAVSSRVDGNTAKFTYGLPTFANGGSVIFMYGYAN